MINKMINHINQFMVIASPKKIFMLKNLLYPPKCFNSSGLAIFIKFIDNMNIKNFVKEKYWLLILIAIFIFSFVLDLYVLTRYPLSYGIDGAFYDIQVLSILKVGYPVSNDPPLIYYLLTPFVMLSGNSFLGIKIAMSLIGSLMAFPAFLLTELYSKKKELGSKIPALLAAFMVTVNVNYFAMIGDYMQNLVGVFFLLLLLYFAINWFENSRQWRKFGVLTIILLICNVLTHIYTGTVAIILFFSLLLFSIVFKGFKTHKLHVFDLKILGIFSILIIGCITVLFLIFPVMLSKFDIVISFFNATTTTATNMGPQNMGMNKLVFLSLPYLIGIFASLMIFGRGLKESISFHNKIDKNTLLAWSYIVIASTLLILAIIPSSSMYQSRFMLLAFLPIALIVPLGLRFVEKEVLGIYPKKQKLITLLISLVAVAFALSSFYTAAESFSNMGSTINSDQYNELLKIKQNYIPGEIEANAVIVANNFDSKYWVQYTLGLETVNGVSLQDLSNNYGDRPIYAITSINNSQSQLVGGKDSNYAGSFLLPYGPQILPTTLIFHFTEQGNDSNKLQGDMANPAPPGNSSLKSPGNMTNPPPMNDSRNSTGNMTQPPSLGGNSMNFPLNSVNGNSGAKTSATESMFSSGRVIYTGHYYEIVKL